MHSRWRSKSNTLNSMEREMGRCPTRKHESKKRTHFVSQHQWRCFQPSCQNRHLVHCTSCLIWPHDSSYASEPSTSVTIRGSSKNSSFWGIQEISGQTFEVCSICDPFCLAVRTNQSPGVFLVGNTSPNVKPAHWKMLPAADFFVCTGQGRWSEYPRGIVGWDGMMGFIWLGYNFGRWRSLLVSVCWEARVVERSIFGRQSWIKSDRKQL